MSKNLANQYKEYNSVNRTKKPLSKNSVNIRYCSTCGAELIENEPCVVCRIKDTKQKIKSKKNF